MSEASPFLPINDKTAARLPCLDTCFEIIKKDVLFWYWKLFLHFQLYRFKNLHWICPPSFFRPLLQMRTHGFCLKYYIHSYYAQSLPFVLFFILVSSLMVNGAWLQNPAWDTCMYLYVWGGAGACLPEAAGIIKQQQQQAPGWGIVRRRLPGKYNSAIWFLSCNISRASSWNSSNLWLTHPVSRVATWTVARAGHVVTARAVVALALLPAPGPVRSAGTRVGAHCSLVKYFC